MTCKYCGELLEDRAKFCTACGAKVEKSEAAGVGLNPAHSYSENCAHEGHVTSGAPLTLQDAMRLYAQRALDFKGRSRRSEYWWATLAVSLVSIIVSSILPDLAWIITALTFIPSLSLCIRRLHDIGKSGWCYLTGLIPLVGVFILIIWFCRDSDGANQWGQNPKD